jgi:hypothetical protein
VNWKHGAILSEIQSAALSKAVKNRRAECSGPTASFPLRVRGPEASSLNKSLSLAAFLGLTKFITITAMNLVKESFV